MGKYAKYIKKITAISTVLCFLASNFSFALSPALMLDDIVDKSLAQAIMWLKADLEELDQICEIDGETDLDAIKQAFRQRDYFRKAIHKISAGHPNAPRIEITSYFNELSKPIEQLANHIFSVPVSVTRAGERKDYRLLFSTLRENENTPFPVFFCSEEDLKKLKSAIKIHDRVPDRSAIKEKAIARFIEHEKNLDKYYSDILKNGENGIDYIIVNSGRLKQILIRLTGLRNNLNKLGIKSENVNFILEDIERRQFIFVNPEYKPPIIHMESDKGVIQEVNVYSHSSNQALFTSLTDQNEWQKLEMAISRNFLKASEIQALTVKLGKSWMHEAGTICGLEAVAKRGANDSIEAYNDIDLLYEIMAFNRPEDKVEIERLRNKIKDIKPVDLDTNLETRDYAAGEKAPKRERVKVERIGVGTIRVTFPFERRDLPQIVEISLDESVSDISDVYFYSALYWYGIYPYHESDDKIAFYLGEKESGGESELIASIRIPRSESEINDEAMERMAEELEKVVSAALDERIKNPELRALKEAIPKEYGANGFDMDAFKGELANLADARPRFDKDKIIFSEKVTFDNGLGILLPKLAMSGMKIAVVAKNDRQRYLIDALNEDIVGPEKISCVDHPASACNGATRYYYFKVEGDEECNIEGVVTRDITGIVKQIIDALGHACNIKVEKVLENLRSAARKFAEAA